MLFWVVWDSKEWETLLIGEGLGCWGFWDRWLLPQPGGQCPGITDRLSANSLKNISEATYGVWSLYSICLKLGLCTSLTCQKVTLDLPVQIFASNCILIEKKELSFHHNKIHTFRPTLRRLCPTNYKEPDIWFPTGTTGSRKTKFSYIRNNIFWIIFLNSLGVHQLKLWNATVSYMSFEPFWWLQNWS